jgi:hypothetical protein
MNIFKYLFTIITSRSKRTLIFITIIGLLALISCAGFLFFKKMIVEQNNKNERIKALELALTQSLAHAQEQMQKLTKAQEINNANGNNNEEVNRLKKELDRTLKEVADTKKAFEKIQPTTEQSNQSTQELQQQQPTPQSNIWPTTSQDGYLDESSPTHQTTENNETDEQADQKIPLQELKDKATAIKILDDVLKKPDKKNIDTTRKNKNQKSSDEENTISNSSHNNEPTKTKKHTKKKKSLTKQVNDILDEEFDRRKQRAIDQEIELVKKDCIEQIKKSTKEIITGA